MSWNIWGHTLAETEDWIVRNGFPRFRAKQIQDYLYHRYVYDFDEMKQLPGAMREWLKENTVISKPQIISRMIKTRLNSCSSFLTAPWLKPSACIMIMAIPFVLLRR